MRDAWIEHKVASSTNMTTIEPVTLTLRKADEPEKSILPSQVMSVLRKVKRNMDIERLTPTFIAPRSHVGTLHRFWQDTTFVRYDALSTTKVAFQSIVTLVSVNVDRNVSLWFRSRQLYAFLGVNPNNNVKFEENRMTFGALLKRFECVKTADKLSDLEQDVADTLEDLFDAQARNIHDSEYFINSNGAHELYYMSNHYRLQNYQRQVLAACIIAINSMLTK